MSLLNVESLWLIGIRRSEVQFLEGTEKFFFVPRSWQDEEHLSLLFTTTCLPFTTNNQLKRIIQPRFQFYCIKKRTTNMAGVESKAMSKLQSLYKAFAVLHT